MTELSAEEHAYRERRRKDPLRTRVREERPDVQPGDLPDNDPYLAALIFWDARPSNEDRVELLLEAEGPEAQRIGLDALELWRAIQFRRRSGLSPTDALGSIRADRLLLRTIYAP